MQAARPGGPTTQPLPTPGLPARARRQPDGVRIQQCSAAVRQAFAAQPDRVWSARDLCLHLDGQEIRARMTMVYRVLKTLAGDGLIVREWAEHFGRVSAVYRWQRPRPDRPTLLVCTRCQRSNPLPQADALAALAAAATHVEGFCLDRAQSLRGLCADCTARAARGGMRG